jgi:dihydroorotate dehydrogenase
MYRHALKPVLFQFDPEDVHDAFIDVGELCGRYGVIRAVLAGVYGYRHKSLGQTLHGVTFANPVGLGAGFDKNARLTAIVPSVGFGFEEVGSITGRQCVGNPKPRLWRLKKSQSILVHYGLVNDGAPRISKHMRNQTYTIPLGTSIAKTNSCQTAVPREGVRDYVQAFRRFTDIGDYYTLNISCPNAHGGQPFHDPELLEMLLSKIDPIATEKPIFIKISPDLSLDQVTEVVHVAQKHRIHGFVVSNLTKNRKNERIIDDIPVAVGGMSGKVVEPLTHKRIAHIYRLTNGKMTIIGCGGVFSAQDAYTMITAGASLVQVVTGLIFRGPSVVSEINAGLVHLLRRDGYTNIAEAVGSSHTVK